MTIRQPPIGHMPFPGHRTQKEVREDIERKQREKQARYEILNGLGKDQSERTQRRRRVAA